VSAADFRSRIISAFRHLSSFTLTDFIELADHRRARIWIVSAAASEMRSRVVKQGLIPLAEQDGKTLRFINDRNRWGNPAQNLIEAALWHEFGHQLGFRHSTDRTSIMHGDLTVTQLSPADKLNFIKRLGKP